MGGMTLVMPPLPHGVLGGASVGTLIAFWLSTALLGVFDVSLPRGDAVGVSGVLDVLGLILFGPLFAAAAFVPGMTCATLVRRNTDSPRLAVAFFSRTAGLLVAWGALRFVSPTSEMHQESLWAVNALVIVTSILTELLVVQVFTFRRTGRSFWRLVRGNLHHQSPLIFAQISSGLLALIGYSAMREWSLVVVVALLLLIRQSYALLLDIRETYRTTVEVLVEVAERSNDGMCGHAERTSRIARDIAFRYGLSPQEVERISYAALLHDVNALASGRGPATSQVPSSGVLAGVPFFSEVVSILRLCDGVLQDEDAYSPGNLLAAFIVGLSSDLDALAHPAVSEAHGPSTVCRLSPSLSEQLRARVMLCVAQGGYGMVDVE